MQTLWSADRELFTGCTNSSARRAKNHEKLCKKTRQKIATVWHNMTTRAMLFPVCNTATWDFTENKTATNNQLPFTSSNTIAISDDNVHQSSHFTSAECRPISTCKYCYLSVGKRTCFNITEVSRLLCGQSHS